MHISGTNVERSVDLNIQSHLWPLCIQLQPQAASDVSTLEFACDTRRFLTCFFFASEHCFLQLDDGLASQDWHEVASWYLKYILHQED
jgi:hypothetical protein